MEALRWGIDLDRFHASRSIGHQPFRSACYAPHVALSFDMNGAVSVCAFTRTTPLGRVGEVPLANMWNGTRIQRLRDAVEHDDLTHACSRCAEEIAGGNLHGALSVGFDRFPAQRFPEWPTRMEFALSTRCNLQCIMCSGEFSSAIRTRREGLPMLPERYGDAFLEELDPFLTHLEQARFLGGEPFLAEVNFRIWERMIERGLRVDCNVTTNGTCWTPRVQRVLDALPFSVGISIDGVTRETVEAVRVGASYDQVMENMRRFVGYRDRTGTSLSLTFCLMVQNAHEFVDYLLMAEDLGCQVYVNTVRQPPQHSLYQLPADDLRCVVDQIERQAELARPKLTLNQAVLDEQIGRLRGVLTAAVTDPTTHAFAAARRRRAESLLDVIADAGLSEPELVEHLRGAAIDERVSVLRCDAGDVIRSGEHYCGVDLGPLIGAPASVLHPLLAERLGHRIDIIAARFGGGASARVMSFDAADREATTILTLVRTGPYPVGLSRYAVVLGSENVQDVGLVCCDVGGRWGRAGGAVADQQTGAGPTVRDVVAHVDVGLSRHAVDRQACVNCTEGANQDGC